MGAAGWIGMAVATLAVIGLATAWRPLLAARRAAEYERARKAFHRQREWLEARFFGLASSSGKPRGLRWTDCDFDNGVTYARCRQTGELRAFVAVTIAFEAIEGGLMEGVEAVGNLRAATAVFRYVRRQWLTDGRAIFNLNPIEAVAHFEQDLVLVGEEPAVRTV